MKRVTTYYTCDGCGITGGESLGWMAARLILPPPEVSNIAIEGARAEHHYCSFACMKADLAAAVDAPRQRWREQSPRVQPAEGNGAGKALALGFAGKGEAE